MWHVCGNPFKKKVCCASSPPKTYLFPFLKEYTFHCTSHNSCSVGDKRTNKQSARRKAAMTMCRSKSVQVRSKYDCLVIRPEIYLQCESPSYACLRIWIILKTSDLSTSSDLSRPIYVPYTINTLCLPPRLLTAMPTSNRHSWFSGRVVHFGNRTTFKVQLHQRYYHCAG